MSNTSEAIRAFIKKVGHESWISRSKITIIPNQGKEGYVVTLENIRPDYIPGQVNHPWVRIKTGNVGKVEAVIPASANTHKKWLQAAEQLLEDIFPSYQYVDHGLVIRRVEPLTNQEGLVSGWSFHHFEMIPGEERSIGMIVDSE